MTTKANGDPLEGTITPPSNYPNPVDNSVAMHSIEWAYGVGNVLMDTTAPSAATLSATGHTDTTIGLSWTTVADAGSGVTTYKVYVGGVLNHTVTGGATTYTITGLTAATAYALTVKAVDGAGNLSVASNTVSVTTATNEIQTVTEGGSGLTSFTLTFSGQTTGSLVAAAAASAVQTALEALSNIGSGNVLVSGSAGGPYTVTFKGTLSGTNVAQMTATPTGGSGTVTVATQTQGAA